jgi:hypothetical protein
LEERASRWRDKLEAYAGLKGKLRSRLLRDHVNRNTNTTGKITATSHRNGRGPLNAKAINKGEKRGSQSPHIKIKI